MNRLGRVVAKNNHAIVLKLEQTKKCAECPAHCNKPLIDLFSLRRKLFLLTNNNVHYELIDSNQLLGGNAKLDQVIHISINESDLMISSAWMYLLPILICLITIIMGHYLGLFFGVSTDISSFLGLTIGLVVSYVFLRKKISSKHLKIRPKVTIL